MQESRLGAADLLDMGQEGDDVVAGRGLDRLDPGRVDQLLAACGDRGGQGADRLRRDGAEFRHRLGGGELDVEPDAEPGLGREDRRHLGPAVARDHALLTMVDDWGLSGLTSWARVRRGCQRPWGRGCADLA